MKANCVKDLFHGFVWEQQNEKWYILYKLNFFIDMTKLLETTGISLLTRKFLSETLCKI